VASGFENNDVVGYSTYRLGAVGGDYSRGHKKGKRSYRCRFCGANCKTWDGMMEHISKAHKRRGRREAAGEWTV
jgi:hypothetical protein